MQGKLEEAATSCARAWSLKEGSHDITNARILFMRTAVAILKHESAAPYVRRLKTLLGEEAFATAGNVASQWDVDSLIESLGSQLSEADRRFLTALAAALNDRAGLTDLGDVPSWRDSDPVALSAPWPDSRR